MVFIEATKTIFLTEEIKREKVSVQDKSNSGNEALQHPKISVIISLLNGLMKKDFPGNFFIF